MRIKFIVPGEVKGKARPRAFRKKSGGIGTYTPDATVEYENKIAFQYVSQFKEGEEKNVIQDKPFVITMEAHLQIPKSYTKKKRLDCINGKVLPTKKPDVDNIQKIVFDALNGVAYNDDKQCVGVFCGKMWSQSGEWLQVELSDAHSK